MYISPAVRTIRDDPTPDVESKFIIRLSDDADPQSVGDIVRDAGGAVETETRFNNLRVNAAHDDVAALLDALPDSVEAVETAVPLREGDSGEDVDEDS